MYSYRCFVFASRFLTISYSLLYNWILGVIFNNKGTWSNHINFVITKCSCLLFAYRQIRSFLSPSNLKRLYFSLVFSVIDFWAPLYVGLSAKDALQLNRLQKRFHRVIRGTFCDGDCLPSLDQRLSMLTSNFLNKIMDNGSQSYTA